MISKMRKRTPIKLEEGLTPDIVQQISKEKKDPAWMELFRLQSLQIYNELKVPEWGPSIEGLDMDHIVTYVRPNTRMTAKWSEVPQDIKDTFERLGIPQAERKSLAGVGAQYDSELVYHNVRAGGGRPGRCVYRYGKCPERGVRRHGAQAFHEAGKTHRPQVCRPARGCLVRRIVRICAAGCFRGNSAAVLFPV